MSQNAIFGEQRSFRFRHYSPAWPNVLPLTLSGALLLRLRHPSQLDSETKMRSIRTMRRVYFSRVFVIDIHPAGF
jgi:hypothetical protein